MNNILITTGKKTQLETDIKDPLELLAVLSIVMVQVGKKLGYTDEKMQAYFKRAMEVT